MNDAVAELRIAVPSFDPAIADRIEPDRPAPRLPAAEWFLARGDRAAEPTAAWRQWLLGDAGLGHDLLERFPAGPCTRAAWTAEPAGGVWACAAPVHLVTAIDHLQLAAPAPLVLDAGESAALFASLDAHLAGTGFRLHAFPGRGWLCECPPDFECTAVEPAVAVGRNLREFLPAGREAARVRGLVNELQMLLHEHPVNERRTARGVPPMNSLWLWGFGATVEPRALARGALLTDDDWVGGLWRLHGGEVSSPDRLGEILRQHNAPLRVGFAPTSSDGERCSRWAALEASIFAPARAALVEGAVQHVSLRIGDAIFDVPRSARWRVWRKSRPFAEALR